MTTYSTAQLAERVLKDLGLVGADETPSAEDQEWTEETVTSEVMMLNATGIPVWNGSEIDIPQEYLTTLSRRVGLAVAPSYGLINLAEAQMAMREAERYLSIMAAPRGVSPLQLRADDSQSRVSQYNYLLGR